MYIDAALFVTLKCNLRCPHCVRMFWATDHPNYQMSLNELETILGRMVELGQHYQRIRVSGGEPTLWKHFREGLKMIKGSNISDEVWLMSNCILSDKITKSVGLGYIDVVRTNTRVVTKTKANVKETSKLEKIIGTKLSYADNSEHFPHPWPPIKRTLPADCGCYIVTFLDYKVYQCPNDYDHSRFLSLEPRPIDLMKNWVVGLDRPDNLNRPICMVCLANGKVYKRLASQRIPYVKRMKIIK